MLSVRPGCCPIDTLIWQSRPTATLTPTPSALSTDSRALAPDLARGFMLLLIALANTPWYLYGSPTSSSSIHPTDGTTLDSVVQFVIITAVDSRVYPMFAFLFGYGIVQMYQRSRDRGAEPHAVRRVLRRRHLWMIVIGAAHAALCGSVHRRRVRTGRADLHRRLPEQEEQDASRLGQRAHRDPHPGDRVRGHRQRVRRCPAQADNFLAGIKDTNAIESWPASILPGCRSG